LKEVIVSACGIISARAIMLANFQERDMSKAKLVIMILFLVFSSELYSQVEKDQINAESKENKEKAKPSLSLIWSFQAQAREETDLLIACKSAPLYADSNVYFAFLNGVICSANGQSGIINWKFTSPAPIERDIAIADELLIFASGVNLIALNRADGSLKWMVELAEEISAGPLVDNSRILCATGDGQVLMIIDSASGNLLEEHQLFAEGSLSTDLYMSGKSLYFATTEGKVSCWNTASSSLKWQFEAGAKVMSSLLEHDGYLFFGSEGQALFALNSNNGKLRWRQRITGSSRGVPVIVENFVSFSARDRTLRVYDYRKGAPAKFTPETINFTFDKEPAIDDNKILMPIGQNIISLFFGSRVIRTSLTGYPGSITSDLLLDKEADLLFFGNRSGKFSAYSFSTSETKKSPESAIAFIEEIEEEIEPESKSVLDSDQTVAIENGAVRNEAANQIEIAENIAAISRVKKRTEQIVNELSPEAVVSQFTINLGLFCTTESLARLIALLEKETVLLLPKSTGGKICYFVCINTFSSRDLASEYYGRSDLLNSLNSSPAFLRLDSFIETTK
jgi:outer membrane protein assembly factor BamB